MDDVIGTAVANMKMAYMKEKAQCVLWYHETKLSVTFPWNFRNEYGWDHQMHDLYAKFRETDNCWWP